MHYHRAELRPRPRTRTELLAATETELTNVADRAMQGTLSQSAVSADRSYRRKYQLGNHFTADKTPRQGRNRLPESFGDCRNDDESMARARSCGVRRLAVSARIRVEASLCVRIRRMSMGASDHQI